MEAIIKYKAKDGTEFTNEKNCIEYEQTIERVDRIMARLPKLPKDDGCSFANGHGFIQHDKDVLISVWNDLLDEFLKKIDHQWLSESNMKAHPNYVGRLVDDYGIRPYSSSWYRMQCIDINTCKEYGQPFYATHPDRAEQIGIK